ncbi:AraC family transcriptional regulator [Plebeiibacterium sediminum]|uniref:AraC family transcriptional regulator n=1 Tax=Plebeiibacterium sediminum TaxID=2992112 RepID=A0AAE3M934_9BACT|nr:AraC family transcriptional regulator [Plebeiobacterium sediminum]MCW3789232.1 AraC family transcriptional regulator [Plebeiobacterium sediminum]
MKEETKNEYSKAVNLAIDYINQNINNSIDLKNIADYTAISEFHFHRIFKAFVGESVGAYITRLRIENAAQKLQLSNDTLTEIAYNTGYQSQHSLSKAFKRHFGISPSAFKNLQTYFSKGISHSNNQQIELNPQIIDVEEKTLVYIRIIAKYGSITDYQVAWQKLGEYAKQQNLIRRNSEFIGLSFDDPNITNEEQCRFYACISTEISIEPKGEFGIYKINGGKFAMFTLKGSYSGLNNLYQAIYFQWLSQSNYTLRNSVSYEKYLNHPDNVAENDLLTEIYIPIN